MVQHLLHATGELNRGLGVPAQRADVVGRTRVLPTAFPTLRAHCLLAPQACSRLLQELHTNAAAVALSRLVGVAAVRERVEAHALVCQSIEDVQWALHRHRWRLELREPRPRWQRRQRFFDLIPGFQQDAGGGLTHDKGHGTGQITSGGAASRIRASELACKIILTTHGDRCADTCPYALFVYPAPVQCLRSSAAMPKSADTWQQPAATHMPRRLMKHIERRPRMDGHWKTQIVIFNAHAHFHTGSHTDR